MEPCWYNLIVSVPIIITKKKKIVTISRCHHKSKHTKSTILTLEHHVKLDQSQLRSSFKRQPNKMAKQPQTIRRQFADELFQCV